MSPVDHSRCDPRDCLDARVLADDQAVEDQVRKSREARELSDVINAALPPRTNHGGYIEVIRAQQNLVRGGVVSPASFIEGLGPDRALEFIVNALGTAAELLQCHDDTGISLDNWTEPRVLVENVIGDSITENHV